MKGDRKKKATHFKTGHSPYNKGWCYFDDSSTPVTGQPCRPVTRRMTVDEFSLVTVQRSGGAQGSILTASDCDGKLGSVKLLRPIKAVKPVEKNDRELKVSAEGNRLIDVTKLTEMVNNVTRTHALESVHCKLPEIQVAREKKWGLAWKYQWKCTNCSFLSPEYKLYNEVNTGKPGPSPACMNLTFQAGLQDTPMGNTRARYLLASADVPPPSRSSMQRTSNIVGKATVTMNQSDMNDKLELLRDTNLNRGLANTNEIGISHDARYNSITFGHSKKPGQGSSQAVSIACEDSNRQTVHNRRGGRK